MKTKIFGFKHLFLDAFLMIFIASSVMLVGVVMPVMKIKPQAVAEAVFVASVQEAQ